MNLSIQKINKRKTFNNNINKIPKITKNGCNVYDIHILEIINIMIEKKLSMDSLKNNFYIYRHLACFICNISKGNKGSKKFCYGRKFQSRSEKRMPILFTCRNGCH